MSVATPATSSGVATPRRSDRSDPLMIISGLRISCAMTVDRRPSDDSRSRCAASRWKRSSETVSEWKVPVRSRASSSSHGVGVGASGVEVRTPVAAISRIVAVSARIGRVTVRATAKLRSVAISTATAVVAPSAECRLRRKARCAVRERATMASGPPVFDADRDRSVPGVSSTSRRRTASYSSPLTVARSTRPSSGTASSAAVTSAGSVEPRGLPPSTNTTSLRVIVLMRSASGRSRRRPAVSVPSTSGCAGSMKIGTDTTCSRPLPCDHTSTADRPASAALTIRWSEICSGVSPGSPMTDRTLPLRWVTTNTSAWTASRYSAASGATVGPCLVSTAAFSCGTSATMRASRRSAVKNSDWNCVTSSPASTRLSSSSASACRVTTTLTR